MTRSLVLAVLALLLTVGQASADCAWVMWSYALSGSGFEAHDIALAYSTRQECEDALSDEATVLKRSGYTNVKGGFPGSHEVIAHKGGTLWRYFCLPDTVDPRGPKGDGR